jgi:hypothetical protein
LIEPYAYADPELKSLRRYTDWSAAEVLMAARTDKNDADDDRRGERMMRDILN